MSYLLLKELELTILVEGPPVAGRTHAVLSSHQCSRCHNHLQWHGLAVVQMFTVDHGTPHYTLNTKHKRHSRATTIQSYGARINRIIQQAINLTLDLPVSLKYYGEIVLALKTQLNNEKNRELFKYPRPQYTINFLRTCNDTSAPPNSPPPQPMTLRQVIDSIKRI